LLLNKVLCSSLVFLSLICDVLVQRDINEKEKNQTSAGFVQEDYCQSCGSPNSVVFHKGSRKLNISTHNSTCSQPKALLIDKENELRQILQEFYKPVSQRLNIENLSDNSSKPTNTFLPEKVTHDTFHKQVLMFRTKLF
jgi:hypothetical protein